MSTSEGSTETNNKSKGTATTTNTSDSALSFIIWVGSYIVYIAFLAWAFLPDSILHPLGITYYPSRYYALAIPSYVILVVLLMAATYIGFNMINTNDPDDFATIRDRKRTDGRDIVTKPVPAKYLKCGKYEGIPDFGDIDPIEMSKHLAGFPT